MDKRIELSLSTFKATVECRDGAGAFKLILNSPDNNTEFFIEIGEYMEFMDFLATAREYCLYNREQVSRGRDNKPSGGYPF